MQQLTLLSIIAIVSFIGHTLSTQYSAIVTRATQTDYLCEYADSSVFSIVLPPDTSTDLFQHSLQLRIGLAPGTTILGQNIKILWNSIQTSTIELSNITGTITTSINLTPGQNTYQLVIWNSQSIVNPFYAGEANTTFIFLPYGGDSQNFITGALATRFVQRTSKL